MEINPKTAYIKTGPVQYINREGILNDCGKYIARWGRRAVVSGGLRAMASVEKKLADSLDSSGIKWEKHIFTGECSNSNISLIKEMIGDMEADVMIGVGGGKSLDTAKAAAEECGIPVVCIPTIAATCAGASAVSITYNDSGVFERTIFLKQNPNLVIVDPCVIANAPAEYLQSGIFDSISKWYEGNAAIKSIKSPDVFTCSAVQLAFLLYKTMEAEAVTAVESAKNKKVSPQLLHIIDLNIYLTAVIQSMGQATVMGAAAHAVHNGLSVIPESHKLLHGFKVGYGIIVQLFLEKQPIAYIKDVVGFFKEMGLVPSLKGLGLNADKDAMTRIAEKASLDSNLKAMPFAVDVKMIVEAMEKAESLVGRP